MNIIKITSPLTELVKGCPTIVLAGPKGTADGGINWRGRVVVLLTAEEYEGNLVIPEWGNFRASCDPASIHDWHVRMNTKADAILVWFAEDSLESDFSQNIRDIMLIGANRGVLLIGCHPNAPANIQSFVSRFTSDRQVKLYDNLDSLVDAGIHKLYQQM